MCTVKPLCSLEFADETILEKVKRRCHRKLLWKKHARTNQWTSALFEKELKEKRHPQIEIKKVNPLVGLGVFALETIPELAFIGEYTGVVRGRDKKRDIDNDYVFSYVIGPHNTPWVIDAETKGNFTRYINHSYEPNLTSRWIISDNIAHVILFANRPIHAGEQLTYDYGPLYWKGRPFPQNL